MKLLLPMVFDIITIFPKIFDSYLKESLISKAIKKKLVKINIHNLRDFTNDKRKPVDDKPFGGERGMIVKVEPILKAVSSLTRLGLKNNHLKARNKNVAVILFTPRGKKLNQKLVYKLSKLDQIIMICGRYEGVDERISKYLTTYNISCGDYVLMGGEIPSLIILESVSRLIPGVIGKSKEMLKKRVTKRGGFIEYPQYTRPSILNIGQILKLRIFKNSTWKVPKVLLSGNHKKIEEWRQKHSSLID